MSDAAIDPTLPAGRPASGPETATPATAPAAVPPGAATAAASAPAGQLGAPFTPTVGARPPLTPTAGAAPVYVAPAPERIGEYRIRGVLGVGGMGVVYDAEQARPHRRVALKVMRDAVLHPDVVRRFAREAEVLARLQHPGIAQIHAAGTADGPQGPQPYFAMERVDGQPLTAFAAGAELRARLALFARVCDAVHYAHQRGVIHRDLKPANVLVDASGQPKVLDFGVARLTDADVQGTLATATGEVVGTLQYMSPEQLGGDPLAVDTRTDVYALGVILYELLAGRRPYDVAGRQLYEAARVVLTADPPALGTVDRRLRGDLETIAAKALEKEPARRYASAAGLAGDVRRYLADEPITARPASTAYQLRKLARRHRAVVAGGAVAASALVAGTAASAWSAVRARAAEQVAVAERADAVAARRLAERRRAEADAALALAERRRVEAEAGRAAADAARREALGASARAEASAATARAEAGKATAVSGFLTDMLGAADPEVTQGRALTVAEAADRAAARLDSGALADQPTVKAAVHVTLAGTYAAVAAYDSALRHFDAARALRARLGAPAGPADVALALGRGRALRQRNDFAGAARAYQEALAGARALAPPDRVLEVQALGDLAYSAYAAQRPAEAESLTTAALAIARRHFRAPDTTLAHALRWAAQIRDYNNNPAAAEPFWREAVAMRRQLHGDRNSKTALALYGLGYNRYLARDYAAAEAALREVLPVMRAVYGAGHPNTSSTLAWLGSTMSNQGRLAEAEPLLREALAANIARVGPAHPDVQLWRTNLARVHLGLRRYADAETLFVQARAARLALLGPNHAAVASSTTDLAALAAARGDLREAERRYREAIPIWRTADQPPWELNSTAGLGGVLVRGGRHDEAEPLLREAIARLGPALGPANNVVVDATFVLAEAARRRGALAAADSLHRLVLARRRVPDPRSTRVARSLDAVATVAEARGDTAAALPLLRELVAGWPPAAAPAGPADSAFVARVGSAPATPPPSAPWAGSRRGWRADRRRSRRCPRPARPTRSSAACAARSAPACSPPAGTPTPSRTCARPTRPGRATRSAGARRPRGWRRLYGRWRRTPGTTP
jgi:predicted Ser/Thr protein kinase